MESSELLLKVIVPDMVGKQGNLIEQQCIIIISLASFWTIRSSVFCRKNGKVFLYYSKIEK